jgi:AraC family transcriptional regulator
MKPVIQKFPKTKVIGLAARFIAGVSPETNNLQIIPPLWGAFMARGHEIAGRSSPVNYGVVVCLKESDKKSHPDEMLYLACALVKTSAKPPEGMTALMIPAGSYAVFTHRGAVKEIRHTLNYIYGSWLPKSGRTLRDVPHLEIYDERFKPKSPDSEFDVCVPVE